MTCEPNSVATLDYYPCRYGHSKLLFRSPRRRLEGQYCAVLGGSETYGKYVRTPYPALLESQLGVPVVNFGYMNAGADVFLNEPVIIDACNRARVAVIQLLGAHNMSNRFYSVHPRRNDRFLRASQLLKSIFPEMDFTDIHFTRHLLLALKARSLEKYTLIEAELKAAWVARMRLLLQKISGTTVLVWIDDPHPADDACDGLGPEPVLIDAGMVEELRSVSSAFIRINPSAAARAEGTLGMEYPEMETLAAARMAGPRVHAEIADALAPILRRYTWKAHPVGHSLP